MWLIVFDRIFPEGVNEKGRPHRSKKVRPHRSIVPLEDVRCQIQPEGRADAEFSVDFTGTGTGFVGNDRGLILLFAGPVSTMLGAGLRSPENPVFFLTRDYLRGFIVGAPAFMIAQIMVPYLQISGNRGRLAAAVVVMTLCDSF